jgi:hypothetical protein
MGAKLIKLISNPTQAENHEEEEIAMIDPSINEGTNNKYLDLMIIKKKKDN